MKKKLTVSLIFLTSVFLIATAFREDDWLAVLTAKLDSYRTKYPQEKVHIQFDKPYYSLDDEMWLKAYVVNANNNQLSAISSVLYVDLVDDQDSVRKTLALPITNGVADGGVQLSDSLFSAGNYHIKAYTRWMQNFSPNFFFQKDIAIGDARKATSVIAGARFSDADPEELSATLSYNMLADKEPLVSKPVAYALQVQGKTIATGNIKTDDKGEAQVKIKLPTGEILTDAILKTSIKLNGRVIERTFPISSSINHPDVQFFPEGGNLIAGIRSRVGVKVTGADGKGLSAKGVIVDQQNKEVANFTTEYGGMGTFTLQPAASTTYTAVVKSLIGKEDRYLISQALPNGYSLAISTLKDSLKLTVSTSQEMAKGTEAAVVGLQNGVIRFSSKIRIQKTQMTATIADDRFATGIVQFTLIAANGKPLSERLVFVNHHDDQKLTISTNKQVYGRRDRVEMAFDVQHEGGNASEANLSLAVIDAEKVRTHEDNEVTIASNLLLSSDLKGAVETPNYYFTSVSADKERQLDNLLLTQGWRRFTWSQVEGNERPELSYARREGLSVSGTVITLGNKPVPYGKVSLFALIAGGAHYADTVADANGRFTFEGINFEGDIRVIVRGTNAKESDHVRVVLDKHDKPKYGPYLRSNFTMSSDLISYLETTQKRFEQTGVPMTGRTLNLQQVDIRGKRVEDKDFVKDSHKLGNSEPHLVIKKEKIGRYIRMWDVFYGLPNIEVRGKLIYSVGRVVSITRPRREPMLLRIDGTESSQAMLQYIVPQDVEAIEIFNPGVNSALYGNDAYWGVIEITTKRGGGEYVPKDVTNLNSMVLHGLSAPREFYAPVYGRESDSKAADMRSTIHWEPNIVTNAEGKAKVTFYTADEPGTYRATAEGINLDGRLVRQVHTFSVK